MTCAGRPELMRRPLYQLLTWLEGRVSSRRFDRLWSRQGLAGMTLAIQPFFSGNDPGYSNKDAARRLWRCTLRNNVLVQRIHKKQDYEDRFC